MNYYVILFLSLIITMGAQGYLKIKYSTCSKKKCMKGYTGEQVARMILDKNDLHDVKVESISGYLSDHYDPKNKVVRLSDYGDSTIASISVAAHECGHAIQDKVGYFFLRLRHSIIPIVNLASYAGYIAIAVGLFAGILNIVWFGIICELVILAFQLITLPVEFNASRRGLQQLVDLNIIEKEELSSCRGMLIAAALTYVAAVASAILEIFRLLAMVSRRD